MKRSENKNGAENPNAFRMNFIKTSFLNLKIKMIHGIPFLVIRGECRCGCLKSGENLEADDSLDVSEKLNKRYDTMTKSSSSRFDSIHSKIHNVKIVFSSIETTIKAKKELAMANY
jgi:hypothetical protein